MVITFWALFMEDIRVATDMDVSYDKPFGCTSFSIMLFFLLEWACKTWAEPGYALSFFFYIDFVASLSMVLDSFSCFASEGRCALLPAVGGFDGLLQSLQQTTRLARILRLLRVLRIIKIIALLTAKCGSAADHGVAEPSRLGKKLQDKIVRNVIMTVIVLVVVVPFLEYTEADYGGVHGLQMLALARGSASFPSMLKDYEARIEYYTGKYSHKKSLLNVQLFDPSLCAAQPRASLARTPPCTVHPCAVGVWVEARGRRSPCLTLSPTHRRHGAPGELDSVTELLKDDDEQARSHAHPLCHG